MEPHDFCLAGVDVTSTAPVKKCFTVEEANAALPLVSRVVKDVVTQYEEVMRLQAMATSSDGQEKDLDDIDRQRHDATARLNDLVAELTEIGCELKDWEYGLVDFPALMNGHEVYLCWKLGEQRVSHWHDLYSGFSGRESIEDPGAFAN